MGEYVGGNYDATGEKAFYVHTLLTVPAPQFQANWRDNTTATRGSNSMSGWVSR